MSAVSALVAAANLLLAIVVYALASSNRRVDALRLALIGSFLTLALADVVLGLRGSLDSGRLTAFLILDVLLVCLAAVLIARDREDRVRLEAERAAAVQEQARLAEELLAERAERELALRDRASGAF